MPERDDSPTIDTASLRASLGSTPSVALLIDVEYDESEPDALAAPSWSR